MRALQYDEAKKVEKRLVAMYKITNIAYNRAIDDKNEFDEQKERHRLHELLRHNHAKSVYGSAASSISHSQSDHYSIPSVVTAKRADAAAELAVKEAHYQMLLEEERQKELIRELEEQQRKALEAQKLASPCHTGIPSFAQIFQDSIALNRLPVPEPYVFNGDPIQFIEWKSAFTSLIDQRVITPAEKLYYLKKYVGGPARQVLEGTFYRNDNEAYQDAWNRLNHRFGQPFAIQRAFREKLNSWPRISPKDAEGLRRSSDFLNACQDAMPHVKGLDILNDCQENQKLVRKLPDWAALRWNRQVTKA
ncbi:hypothetical protein DPEC_G00186340 [Dallia pectoralis]|uniref:Uncharacterized protein n=1 Tax=Dallia pectoralis TaxID=75939 RepID=A0ACC2GBH4_DALPE|nr:hypothetical protein DPEC_G00186340 [Dallia pectoralis]